MLTLEALREMRSRLTPGGRLVINTVSYADTDRPSLQGIESTAVAAFGEAMVYPGVPESDDPDELVNVLIVAGEHLDARHGSQLTAVLDPTSRGKLDEILARGRSARADAGRVCTDDRSDLDYTQAAMRIRWRKFIWDELSSDVLWD